MESLDEAQTKNIFLKAEILFVKATYFGYLARHREAAKTFLQAADLYFLERNYEKQVLSMFNSFIASTYHPEQDFNEDQQMQNILQLCEHHQVDKVKFLCDRHISFRYFENGDFTPAIDILLPWTDKKNLLVKSDIELALLHIADCFWEMKDLRKALFYFDQVSENIDERVRFPKAVVEAKIWQKSLDIASFPLINDHWLGRYTRFAPSYLRKAPKSIEVVRDLSWNFKTGILARGRKIEAKIKNRSLEGQLLRMLIHGSRSKAALCESLWPSEMDIESLNDRFHQVIQRIQRKIPNLVVFDGQAYRLSKSLKILN